jgi:hypothetical protein
MCGVGVLHPAAHSVNAQEDVSRCSFAVSRRHAVTFIALDHANAVGVSTLGVEPVRLANAGPKVIAGEYL